MSEQYAVFVREVNSDGVIGNNFVWSLAVEPRPPVKDDASPNSIFIVRDDSVPPVVDSLIVVTVSDERLVDSCNNDTGHPLFIIQE